MASDSGSSPALSNIVSGKILHNGFGFRLDSNQRVGSSTLSGGRQSHFPLQAVIFTGERCTAGNP